MRSSHKMFYNFPASILFLLCIFSSTALAASAVIGVDLGTEYIKATIVKPGIPLDIVLTKDSRRKELSVIAFKPEKNIKIGQFPERVYGSDAIALASRFPGDVYPNLKTLLGLGIDHPIVKEYASRHPSLKLVTEKTKGTAAFQSASFAPEELPWTVEEILAMQLQNIQKNAQALAGIGITIKDMVITVPTYFTLEEKRAVALASKLAGLHILEMISDGLAVGINYATTRTFPSISEGGKAETHLVFDMGAGSTKVSVLKFQGRTVKDVGKFNKTIQEIKVLGSGWDKTLGGDLFNKFIVDDILAQFIASPAVKKLNLNFDAIKKNGKVAAKLQKEAEKIRHVLSANANTQAFFEGLYEDLDFKYKITRAEFEKLTEACAARITTTVQNSLDAAKLEIKNIDSVILHGGASRTPFVHKELEKFIGDTSKIKNNVNSDESAVFGAGFRGAALSPSFRVKEIRVWDSMSYACGMKWNNNHGKLQSQGLWKSTSFIGSEKQYSFKNIPDPFILSFYQRIPSPEIASSEFLDQDILTLTTQNLTESVNFLKEKHGCTDSDITTKLSTQVTAELGEVEVTELIVSCEVEVSGEKEGVVNSVKGLFGFGKKDQAPLNNEESSDSDSTKSTSTESSHSSSTSATPAAVASSTTSSSIKSAQEDKTKPSKQTQAVPIKYSTEIKGHPQFPDLEISRITDRLSAFSTSDNLRRLRDEALNRLESFTYKVREFFDDPKFIAVSTEQERSNIESKSMETSDWIYSGGTEASREELKERLKQLKSIVAPIEFRQTEAVIRSEKISAFQNSLNQTKLLITSITEQIANDEKKHADFSASKTESQASATDTASPIDEKTNSGSETSTPTESAPKDQQTLDPPVYTKADVESLQKIYDEFSVWLADKIVKQEDLKPTDDPVLLSRDIEEKMKALQETQVKLLVKNVRKPPTSKGYTKKTKTNKTQNQKTMADTDTNTKDSTSTTTNIPRATFTMGPGGQMPSEEEMLEHLKNIESQYENGKPTESEDKENTNKAETKHDEL